MDTITYTVIDYRIPQKGDWYIDKFGNVVRQKDEKFSRRSRKKQIVRKEIPCTICNKTGVEMSGVCHCGAEMEGHSVYDDHSATEMTRPCSCQTPLFYIQNKGFCGDCLKWWRTDGHGYTLDLDQAWQVTAEKAASICHDRPKEDRAWPCKLIDAVAARHVNSETLNARLRKEEDVEAKS